MCYRGAFRMQGSEGGAAASTYMVERCGSTQPLDCIQRAMAAIFMGMAEVDTDVALNK
jgi:hypothetical protein